MDEKLQELCEAVAKHLRDTHGSAFAVIIRPFSYEVRLESGLGRDEVSEKAIRHFSSQHLV